MNDTVIPKTAKRRAIHSMTASECWLSIIVLLIGIISGLLSTAAGLSTIYSEIYPEPFSRPNPLIGIVYGYIMIACGISLTFVITSARNLYWNKLFTVSTLLKCTLLCLTWYLLPLGVWGFVLLSQRLHRDRLLKQQTAQ